MKPEEFINQQIKAGYKIHFHQGVWWENVLPFYCKPALLYQEIIPRKSKPKLTASILGYSHCVPDKSHANKMWEVMILDSEKLKSFSIEKLSTNRRNLVRKGLKKVEVRKIIDIKSDLEDLQEICVSMAKRTRHGKQSKSCIYNLFNLPGREWWGAYYKQRLVAYLYCYQIDDTIYLDAHKCHTDYLNKNTNDALLYTFILHCKSLSNCNRINFGDWNRERSGINEFKMKYGFEKVNIPVYANYNPLVRITQKVMKNRLL